MPASRLSRPARPGRWLALAGAVFLALIASAAGLTIWDLRVDALSDARVDALNLDVAIAEQTERALQAVDLTLQDVRTQLVATASDNPSAPGSAWAARNVHRLLAGRLRNLPQVAVLSVLDADGRVANWSRARPPPAISAAGRAYFRALAAQESPDAFIGAPARSRVSGEWTIFLARRIDGPGHAFLGIVLAAIRLGNFEDFYSSISMLAGRTVTLLRRDGTILVRYPPAPGAIGTRIPPRSEWHRVVAEGGGQLRLRGLVDHRPHIVSIRPLSLYPIVVDVGVSVDATLAHWRRQALVIGIGTACAIALLLLLLWTLSRQFRRLEAQRAELVRITDDLRASELRLKDKSAILESTLANMDQGLLMVDGSGRVVVCNQRTMDLLDLPRNLMEAQPLFQKVLEYQWQQDEFARTDCAVRAFIRAGGILDVPHAYERQRPNGTVIEIRSIPLAGGGVVRTYTDITERRSAEAQIRYHARHDELTGLANRVVFQQQLGQATAAGQGLAVLYLDLDRFKAVNDSYGHAAGDLLLRQVAQRIRTILRESDAVARMGGDEFAILQTQVEQPRSAAALAQRLAEAIAAPYDIQGQPAAIGVSIGIALYPENGTDPDALVRNADTALYRAKQDGRSTFRFFTQQMDARQQQRFRLEQDLSLALERRQFALGYQPMFTADRSTLCGMEALLAWHHPTLGTIEPRELVPMAEASGMIVALGYWVLETACAEAARWPAGTGLAINLSAARLRQPEMPARLLDILRRHGLAPGRIKLEITESLLLDAPGQMLDTMHRLGTLGVGLTLDNFGARQANLSHLRRFPFDGVKFAKRVVQSLSWDEEAETIADAAAALCRRRRLHIAADGVNTTEQLAAARLLGCSQIQGALTGSAMNAAEAGAYLARQPAPSH